MKKLDVKFFENFNDNIDLKRVLSVEVSQLNKNLSNFLYYYLFYFYLKHKKSL